MLINFDMWNVMYTALMFDTKLVTNLNINTNMNHQLASMINQNQRTY